MTGPPTEQELVVHAFAPLRGRHAERGWASLLEVWRRSGELLGTTEPVPTTGLPVVPPAELLPGRPEVLAAAQNEHVDVQLVLRRTHDVAALAVLFAAPDATGLAAGAPPGWAEFHRWWAELSEAGTDGLLGVAELFLCKAPVARDSLPRPLRGAVNWSQGYRHDDLLLWEPPTDTEVVRYLVVSAPTDQDAELSRWTWSRGDLAMSPLGRYLAQAAKLRHHIRVWQDDEQWLARLRAQVDVHVDELRSDLARAAVVSELHGDEAGLVVAADRVDRMRDSVQVSRSNMTALLGSPLPADVGLAESFLAQLGQEGTLLDRSRSLAQEVRALAPPHTAPAGPVRSPDNAIRLGLTLDIVQYTAREPPEMQRLQQRLLDLVVGVLGDLGLTMSDTDHQGTGDGLMMFLPAEVDVQRALPSLLHGMGERLRQDNEIHRDRLRARMALDVGPVGLAALGFKGKISSIMGRMLDSGRLRQAVLDHADVDLVAMVSDRLFDFVVGEGAPGLDAANFTRVDVAAKNYRGDAWLWVAW